MTHTGSNAFKELVSLVLPMSSAAALKYQYDNFQGLVDGVRVWEAIDVTVYRVHLDGVHAAALVSFKTNKGEFSFEYSFEPHQCTVIKEEITLTFLTIVAALKQFPRGKVERVPSSYRTPADNPTQFAKDFAEMHALTADRLPYSLSSTVDEGWLIAIYEGSHTYCSRNFMLSILLQNTIEYLKSNA